MGKKQDKKINKLRESYQKEDLENLFMSRKAYEEGEPELEEDIFEREPIWIKWSFEYIFFVIELLIKFKIIEDIAEKDGSMTKEEKTIIIVAVLTLEMIVLTILFAPFLIIFG